MILQEQLTAWMNILLAYDNASRGKRGHAPAAEFEMLLADHLLEIQSELEEKRYQPGKYHSFYIHEPKKRLISAAPFRDRVVHHALCSITTPIFEKQFIPASYANRVGKGTHRAIRRFQWFLRRHRYVLKCDIRKYFPSIDHEILKRMLRQRIADPGTAWLIDRILDGSNDQEFVCDYFYCN